ncbi:MAG TPA: glycosyltransferase family 39 protein [Anaerolineae bacterium]|nr:glycosyltransferase family 39 protein [Anaerolineae bacterium]
MRTIFSRKETAYFFAILLIGLILRVALFAGLQGSDDLQYIEGAHQFLSGGFAAVPDDLTKTRLLLYLPVSLCFALFGVNEISAALYPLACSIGLMVLVYRLGILLFGPKPALMAMALYALFPIEVIHATMLYPELPMGLFMGLAVYFYLAYLKDEVQGRTTGLWLAGAFVACAYLVKITALLLLGVFFVYFLIYQQRRLRIGYMILGFVLVLLAEALFYLSQTGDFFFQYHLLQSIAQRANETIVTSAQTIYQGRFTGWYRALVYYPGVMLATPFTFSLYYHCAIPAIAYLLWSRKRETYPLLIWLVILFLGLNFGIQGFNPIVFIPAAPRYLMVLSAPLVLLLSYAFNQITTTPWKVAATAMIIALLLVSGWALKLQFEHGVPQTCSNVRALYHRLQGETQPIYVDARTGRELSFLNGYKDTLQLRMYGPETSLTDLSSISKAYVIINRQWINRVELWFALEFPVEVSTPPAHWELIQSFENPFRELNVGIIAALKSLVGMQSNAAAQTLAREQDSNAYIYYVPAMP